MKLTRKNKVVYSKLSKFPPVSRDLALLVKSDIKFADIERIARSTEKKLLKSVELFDVYEGKNIGEGMKSYAVNFILEDSEKTLTDERTDKRNDGHAADDDRNAARIREAADQQRDEEHHTEDHSFQTLPGQESGKGLIRQTRDVADLICP